MKPDYSLVADVAEYAAMTGKTFAEACLIACQAGRFFIRRAISGGAK